MPRTQVVAALAGVVLALAIGADPAHAQSAGKITGSVYSELDGATGTITVSAPLPVGVALVRRGQVVQQAPATNDDTVTLKLADYASVVPGDVLRVTDKNGATLDSFTVPAHPVGGCGTKAATGTLPGDGTVIVKQVTDKGGAEVKAGKPFSVELASDAVLGKSAELIAQFTVEGSANGYATSWGVRDARRICPVSTDFQVADTSFDSAHGRFTLVCQSTFAGGRAQVLATSVIGGRRVAVARVEKRTVKGKVTFHVKVSRQAKHHLFHAHSLAVRVELTAQRAGEGAGVHHTYNFTLHHS